MNQRPMSTIVIGILHLVCAALLLIIGITAFTRNQELGILGIDVTALNVVAGIAVLAVIAEVIAAVGAFNTSSWGWTVAFYTAVIVGAVSLIMGILTLAQASLLFVGLRIAIPFFLGGTLLAGIAHAIEIVFLLQPSTQADFQPAVVYPPSVIPVVPTQTPQSITPMQPTMPVPHEGSMSPRKPSKTQVLDQQEPVVGWLVQRNGGRREPEQLRRSSNVIGRDGQRSQIVLDDSSVSSEHAKIRFENGVFVIHDLASTNGTYVNGRRVEKQRLMDGDVVRLGKTEYVFKSVDPKRR